MNTINNPLKLIFQDGSYRVNKSYDRSGEYVDKALAEEMLKAIEDMYKFFSKDGELTGHLYERCEKLILKAKG